jgi:uncharacterized protein with gpF-like domain
MPNNKPSKYKRGTPVRPPKSPEVKYRKALLALIRQINEALKSAVLPLVRENKDATTTSQVKDSYIGDVNEQFAVIKKMLNLDDAGYNKIGAEFVGMVGASSAARVAQSFERAGFTLPTMQNMVEREAIGGALDALTAENVDLIKNLSNEYLRKIQKAVTDNFLTGKYIGNGGIERELNKISGITKNRAKLIARDQASKISSVTTEIRATNAGSIGYRWHNAQDARVRGNPSGKYPNVPKNKNHWDREGNYYLWKPMKNPPIAPDGNPLRQPPVDGSPGIAINCRCFSAPLWIEEDGEFVGG